MHRPLTRVSTSWQTCWQSQSRSGACCWEMPKCCAPQLPRQFGEVEPVVCARDIVPKTLALCLKRSTKEERPCAHAEFDVQLTRPSSMSANAVCGSTPRQTQSGTG